MKKGYTLVEILVVITVFAVIAVVSSQTIILTLRNTQKASSISNVRQNLDQAMLTMVRLLHNAKSISSCTLSNVTYLDQNYKTGSFSCVGIGTPNSYIASGAAALTSSSGVNGISIIWCSFSCTNTYPPVVTINVSAFDINKLNGVTESTQATIRSY